MVNRHYSIWSVLILQYELHNCTRDLQKRFPRKEIWNIGRYPQCSRLTFSKLQILLITNCCFTGSAMKCTKKHAARVARFFFTAS